MIFLFRIERRGNDRTGVTPLPQGIIDKLGGTIKAANGPKGARITIELPECVETAEAAPVPPG